MRIMWILGKLNFFFDDAISGQIFNGSQDLGLIFQIKKILIGLYQPAAWPYEIDTLFFKGSTPLGAVQTHIPREIHQPKFVYQTLFSTKSTTLNSMVKSDLVTSSDGTIRFFLFLQSP